MIQTHLDNLKNFILRYNTYFQESFSDVSQDPITGYIASGETIVFPNDSLGNYFYLRVPNFIGFDTSNLNIIEEGVNPIGLRMPIVLVACVREADDLTLLENLLTTITQYLPECIKLTKCTSAKEIVIAQELAKLNPDLIADAIKRVDMSYTIVSISFDYMFPYTTTQLKCITFPCKC